ncbi:LysE family transporter [Actibacterium sp. 188UL27-1]|uniref:LysE family transporter n=1 Tax=Actibacterium sp. 188UL27-1 TaxID=2786961 RepID=UPI0019574AFA|nr:LysE family transporter [Actibacterium sp. 188UL27-1]MBM7068010.1 LysE family transporter [Actibacterium sp. 188UL27-1]
MDGLWCGAVRQAPTGSSSASVADGAWFRRGVILNLSNPKAVLAWMATLALGASDAGSLWQVGLATLLCIAVGFVIYGVYAMAFSTSGAMLAYGRSRR